jgi:2'-5' RNA ligase
VSRTALVVVVPEAEQAVGSWRDRYDRAAETGVPAHITLLFPFVPAERVDKSLRDDLHTLFARFPAFDFALARVERWVDVVYLAPDPPTPFVRLTEAILAAYPDYPPFEGAYDDVVPHLTVIGSDVERADANAVERAIAPRLPIASAARDAVLLEELPSGRWRERDRFPFVG